MSSEKRVKIAKNKTSYKKSTLHVPPHLSYPEYPVPLNYAAAAFLCQV